MSGYLIDIEGTRFEEKDAELFQHTAVQGMILFTRNFDNTLQLKELIQDIRNAVQRPFLISVDHEGGRVQRFRSEFSPIPAMASFYQHYPNDLEKAQNDAKEMGWLMAYELRCLDIDLSYAPVLDVFGDSEVIGNRAFAEQPELIVKLASAFMQGMREAGMRNVGKHFPGHGTVVADSHIAIPEDMRSKQEIWSKDLVPFKELVDQLDAIMPAHVIYPELDTMPAGFSKFWVQDVLREELGFKGVVISDDLTMEGAKVVGDVNARAQAAFSAGGELLLVCNDREAAEAVISGTPVPEGNESAVTKLLGQAFEQNPERHRAAKELAYSYASGS
ncbi:MULTISPECIES: beta-N-acetylhexosaminidase [Gammaproteobacteria]|uniref:beta-N-acetylhexosaminidase n=1 Tax=Gammaproteobacteria TaxID=1236 RepID=UPI000DCFE547|nr:MULTISPECIES: beta-N-acetylhexosaminidase [Gammaproteobacteria]RTE87412.1 beta-N-acetylhexosaminidase [Aliidiomarina sp. B3213]TCZ92802.1 beta-N-acetylhexosaminidase [Lysobacter sp. N42]